MVALDSRSTDFKGVRLFDPGRDLASVARYWKKPFGQTTGRGGFLALSVR
ncbi:MAG: hypothetical protein HY782_23640 [Chloroflexi bacterium]|nr:hypothetical protein [Chloroflexota bacterium]